MAARDDGDVGEGADSLSSHRAEGTVPDVSRKRGVDWVLCRRTKRRINQGEIEQDVAFWGCMRYAGSGRTG
jgi:hypothetical protein